MNPHARRHQQQQLLRDYKEVEVEPPPDNWCVVCGGKGGWYVVAPFFAEWEVCVFCDNGPDDTEEAA